MMPTLMPTLTTTQAWLVLVVAGLLETGWAIGLKYAEGFTRPLPSALTIVALVASMWLLGMAAKTLPIGTAYAVWVGIGALGAALLGWRLLDEPMSVARVICLGLLLAGIIGLKLTAPSPSPSTSSSSPSP
jgi:quaternary ammonium compound-resistance protein SugE